MKDIRETKILNILREKHRSKGYILVFNDLTPNITTSSPKQPT